MTYRKILLKSDEDGIVYAATMRGDPPVLLLPKGVTAKALLADGMISRAEGGAVPLPKGGGDFSLVATMGETLLFASTLPEQEKQMAKWHLLNDLRKENLPKKVPTAPLEAAEGSTESFPEKQPSEPTLASDTPQEEELTNSTASFEQKREESLLERARRLIETGTPFPLFESLMPGSKWALVPEEEAPYLVGIKEEDGEEHVLYGVPGARDFPPDDDLLWSYFPVGEEGDGYFLTEANRSFPTET